MAKKTKAQIEEELAEAAALAEAEAKAKVEAEEKERLRVEEAGKRAKEAELKRREEELERFRAEQAGAAVVERARADLLHRQISAKVEMDSWASHVRAAMCLDAASTAHVNTFMTSSITDLEACLKAADDGLSVRGGLLVPGQPFQAAMSFGTVVSSGAAAIARHVTRLREEGDHEHAAAAQLLLLEIRGIVNSRIDATTAALLEAASVGGAGVADSIFNLKDGVRELWLHDTVMVSESAGESQQSGIDSESRAQAAASVGLLRTRIGAEMLVWCNLPPGRTGRARLISTTSTPSGDAAPSNGRMELSIELHKAIVNTNVALRVMRTEWDPLPSEGDPEGDAIQAAGNAIMPRITNEPSTARGRGGARVASAARPASGRPASSKAEAKTSSRPDSARLDDAESKQVEGEAAPEEPEEGKEGDKEGDFAPEPTPKVEIVLDASSQLRSVGGVIHMELLALPPSGSVSRQWTITPIRANFQSHQVRRLPHPLQTQGPSACQSQAVRVKWRLPSNVITPPEPLIVASWTREHAWRNNDITEVSFDAATRMLSWSTIYFAPHALVMPRHVDLPFASWSLKPASVPSEQLQSINALMAHSRTGAKTQPAAVLFTLEGPRFRLSIRVTELGCALEEPAIPQLKHLLHTLVQPGELLQLLEECGLWVQPLDSDAAFVNSNKERPARGTIRPRLPAAEYAVLEHIAACASTYEVSSSKWNADPQVPSGVCVFLAREANDQLPAAVQALPTSWRTVLAREDGGSPTGVQFVFTTDAESSAAGRWLRRVRPQEELAAAQSAANATASAENSKRDEAYAVAKEAAEEAALSAAIAAGEGVEPAPVELAPVEYVAAPTLSTVDLATVGKWSGQPENGDAGLAHAALAATLAARASPAALQTQANSSPMLATVLMRLLRLVRPMSFTA